VSAPVTPKARGKILAVPQGAKSPLTIKRLFDMIV
jgi:hypothetical protein